MTFLSLVPAIYFNVKQQANVIGDGSNDDTVGIQAAITLASSGGVVFFPPGTYKISSPLTLSVANTVLLGTGVGSTIIASSGFSGAQMILCSANNTGVVSMAVTGGPSTTYSSNVATNGIQVTGATGVRVEDALIQYVNGWCVQSTATSGQANLYLFAKNVRASNSAQGFHSLGVSGSGNSGNQHFIGCTADHIQNGDCFLFEDVNDIEATNLFGSCTAGSGNAIHIKGNCSAIFIENVDCGPYPGPTTGATVLIESDGNGSPNFVTMKEGILLAGTSNITITAGTQIILSSLHIFNGGTYGINITGGDNIQVRDCIFSSNGTAGSSGRYDLSCTTSGAVEVSGCRFGTPQGTSSQHTNNAINFSTGTLIMRQCKFAGSGYTSANIFNGTPTIVQDCPGYNPLGKLTAPTITASPYTTSVGSTDITAFITGGTVSSIAISGNATGLTSGAFRVRAGETITITYTVAPTWTWFGD